jgi:Zn-dependent protease with chaperone function
VIRVNNVKVEGILAMLLLIVGTIIMSWSVFTEEGLTTIGLVGLLVFGVGMIFSIGILLDFYSRMREKKIDWDRSDSDDSTSFMPR